MKSQIRKYVLLGLVLTAIAFLLVAQVDRVDNPDVWLHLKTGQFIWEDKSLPLSDSFSFTAEGQTYILHEWLAQLLFYLVFLKFSFIGLIALKVLIAWLTAYILFKILRLYKLSWFWIGLLTFLAFFVSEVYFNGWAQRPQIFTFLFVSLVIYLLERYRLLGFKRAKKSLWLLLPLFLIWSNLHSGFIVGLGLVFFYALMALFKRRGRHAYRLLIVASLSFFVTFLNPNFYQAHLYLFTINPVKAGLNVMEWMPIWKFEFTIGFAIFLGFAISLWLFFLLSVIKKRISLQDALLLAILTFFGFKMARNVPLFVLISIPLVGKWIGLAKFKFSKKLASLGLVLVVLGISAFNYFIVESPAISLGWNIYPHGATDFILENKIKGPFYNSYNFGMFLIWKLYPHYQVFIDGRNDLYFSNGIFDEFRIIEGAQPGFEEILDKYQFNFLLVNSRTELPLEEALLMNEDWILVYFDDLSAVFVKNTEENKQIIDQYAYRVAFPLTRPPFREEGQEKEALKEYQRAIEINPDFAGGHYNLASVYEFLGEYDLAIEKMFQSLELFSQKIEFLGNKKAGRALYAQLYSDLADIYAKDENWEQAINFYNQALEIDKNNPLALNNLSLIYTSYQMDKEKSLVMLKRYADYLEREKPEYQDLREKIKELIADVEANGPREKPPMKKSGFIQKGKLEQALKDPLAHLNFQFENLQPLNPTGHSSWNFGAYTDGTASTTTGRSRYLCFTSPNKDNMRVKQYAHYSNVAGTYRMAFYVGTTQDCTNPDGHDKKDDSGQLSHPGSASWQMTNLTSEYDWAANTYSGIAWKNDGASYYYATGNIDDCEQYWDNLASEAADSSSAFNQTLDVNATYTYTYLHYIVYVLYPTISDVDPDTDLTDSQTGVVITGTGFEAEDEFGAGTSKVWITQNNDWDTPGTKVQQTDTAWSNTSITFTVVKGGLSDGTNYLWVENSDGEHNASGYTVTFGTVTQGTILSTGIDFDNFDNSPTAWNDVFWGEDETGDEKVSIQIWYTVSTTCDTIVGDGAFSGCNLTNQTESAHDSNSEGFGISPLDISCLTPVATTYNEICLKAILDAADGGSPELQDWAVSVPENSLLLFGLTPFLLGFINKFRRRIGS